MPKRRSRVGLNNVMPCLQVSALTLFPEMFPGSLGYSLAGKALEDGIWQLDVVNIRDFAEDRHKTVDDKPFGGGAGMVMRPDVLGKAIESVKLRHPATRLMYFSPRGRVLNQQKVRELALERHVTLLCGRFEGVDQRIIDFYNVEEVSLGDFVLSGGEVAALALLDACIRLLPGVITNNETLVEESFGVAEESAYSGLLEYPHYTRPAVWKGLDVPEVLLSGNHAAINKWRVRQAEAITQERRKDLWEKRTSLPHS